MPQKPWEVRGYVDERGVRPFEEWLLALSEQVRKRVDARIDRVASGNFGDHHSVGEGVYELRLFFGPGYRIYYAIAGRQIVLLLAGGDKKSQTKDIQKAKRYWSQYKLEQ